MASNGPARALSREEAAQRLNLSTKSVDRLIRRGELRAVRLLGRVLIPEAAIDALLRGGAA